MLVYLFKICYVISTEVKMSKLLAIFFLSVCLILPVKAEAGRCGPPAPKALRNSKEKQKQQNRAANKYGLIRLKDLNDLQALIKSTGKLRLVQVTSSKSYWLNKNIGQLDPNNKQLYRYVRVWTKAFLDKETAAARKATGDRYEVAGMVRTDDYQKKLHNYKGNKLGAIRGKKWWQQSSHLTGSTVDISLDGMSSASKKWWRKRLQKLQKQGKVIAVEEVCGNHFHIMVLPTYK